MNKYTPKYRSHLNRMRKLIPSLPRRKIKPDELNRLVLADLIMKLEAFDLAWQQKRDSQLLKETIEREEWYRERNIAY